MELTTLHHAALVRVQALAGGRSGIQDVRDVQTALGLVADGVVGPKTLAALWRKLPPRADEVVARANAALRWSLLEYSMSRNTGLGERWLADHSTGFPTGDCSDFVSHCLGLPKDQTRGLAAPVVSMPVWLGADAIAGGAIGVPRLLADARPGDIIAYAGRWERGERAAIGHVEVCVEVVDGRVWTVGCASSNKPDAIVRADKTAMWRRKGAMAVRPRWYS